MEKEKKLFFINCDDAKYICDKSQYNESSFWDRFRLSVKYLFCNITRSYVKRNRQLSSLFQNNNVDCMCSEAKGKLRTNFDKELKNQE
jgi:hypothetical protein